MEGARRRVAVGLGAEVLFTLLLSMNRVPIDLGICKSMGYLMSLMQQIEIILVLYETINKRISN